MCMVGAKDFVSSLGVDREIRGHVAGDLCIAASPQRHSGPKRGLWGQRWSRGESKGSLPSTSSSASCL